MITEYATPYNEKAEKAVIGSIIMDCERVMGICTERRVNPLWFQKPAHRVIFSALTTMPTVDTALLGEALQKSGDFDVAGGWTGIEEIIDATPTSYHAEHYIEILEKNYRLRMLDSFAVEASSRARNGSEPDDIISDLSSKITELTAHSEAKTPSDSMSDNLVILDNAYNGKTSGIALPWERLTQMTGGCQIGAVIPFVGRDGKGKSGAVAQIMDFWIGNYVPTLCFSLEDVKRRVILRMGGNREKYSARTVETGYISKWGQLYRITEAEKSELEEKIRRYMIFLDSVPFWIHDEPHNVEQICDRIRHYKRTRNVKAVTIDGFKDIVFTKGKTTNEAQTHISQRLCAIARECDVAILVVSHIRKTDDNAPIAKQDIIGASSQFQGARQVIIFQDAGIEGIDGDRTFCIDCTKSNFTRGAEIIVERDDNVLTYTEKK